MPGDCVCVCVCTCASVKYDCIFSRMELQRSHYSTTAVAPGENRDGSSIWAQTGISFKGLLGLTDGVCFGEVHARMVERTD